ncbi:hypothetical protein BS78_01G153100, partial [Paspalum vaginatum]
HEYDFIGVGFGPVDAVNFQHIFRIRTEYYIILSRDTIIYEPQKPVWIPTFPRMFTPFEDVIRQRHNSFADAVGLVIYVSEIHDRNNFRRRASRHVVMINERGEFLVIHVNYEHMIRHIMRWRIAETEMHILAAVFLRVDRMRCGVVTTEDSILYFSPPTVDETAVLQGNTPTIIENIGWLF